MMSFRLKFMKKFFDTEYVSIWKDIFKIYLKRVCSLNLDYELFSLELKKENISCLPEIYQSMFIAWKNIKNDALFNHDYTFIYNQSLFWNSNITNEKGKPLYWKHFVLAGIIQIKDICYEVKTGYLPAHSVIDIVLDKFPYLDTSIIRKQYSLLLQFIPESWTETINTCINFPECDNIPLIHITHGKKSVDLLQHNSRDFYSCLVDKCKALPVAESYWADIFDLDCFNFKSVWSNISNVFKPPDIIENDYKVIHNVIFTKEKLFRYQMCDNDICDVCKDETEDMLHMFITCKELIGFIHIFQTY